MPDKIAALVADYPGLHLREIARQLDTSVALIEYHVPALIDEARVEAQRSDGFVRLFPVSGGVDATRLRKRDRAWLVALREHNALQIALALVGSDGAARHKDLVEQLGMGKSKVTFHLKKLIAVGMVDKTADGFALADPRRAEHLLLNHRPTPDLRDRFAALWSAFYDG